MSRFSLHICKDPFSSLHPYKDLFLLCKEINSQALGLVCICLWGRAFTSLPQISPLETNLHPSLALDIRRDEHVHVNSHSAALRLCYTSNLKCI